MLRKPYPGSQPHSERASHQIRGALSVYNAELKVRQVKVLVRHGVNRSKGCEWSRLGQGEGQGSGWGQ